MFQPLSRAHGVQEVGVGFGFAGAVGEEFHGLGRASKKTTQLRLYIRGHPPERQSAPLPPRFAIAVR